MGNRNDRLDAMLEQFVEQVVVELQTRFVRLLFIPIGENPRPGNRGAQALEAHFREQSHVLLIAMIEVDRLMAWIIGIRINRIIQYAVDDPMS